MVVDADKRLCVLMELQEKKILEFLQEDHNGGSRRDIWQTRLVSTIKQPSECGDLKQMSCSVKTLWRHDLKMSVVTFRQIRC